MIIKTRKKTSKQELERIIREQTKNFEQGKPYPYTTALKEEIIVKPTLKNIISNTISNIGIISQETIITEEEAANIIREGIISAINNEEPTPTPIITNNEEVNGLAKGLIRAITTIISGKETYEKKEEQELIQVTATTLFYAGQEIRKAEGRTETAKTGEKTRRLVRLYEKSTEEIKEAFKNKIPQEEYQRLEERINTFNKIIAKKATLKQQEEIMRLTKEFSKYIIRKYYKKLIEKELNEKKPEEVIELMETEQEHLMTPMYIASKIAMTINPKKAKEIQEKTIKYKQEARTEYWQGTISELLEKALKIIPEESPEERIRKQAIINNVITGVFYNNEQSDHTLETSIGEITRETNKILWEYEPRGKNEKEKIREIRQTIKRISTPIETIYKIINYSPRRIKPAITRELKRTMEVIETCEKQLGV